jgi:hypothetical protein
LPNVHDLAFHVGNDNLWPVIVHHYPEENHILQDDIAPVHRTQSVQNYKAQNNINGMFWPAESAGANMIENCWLLLKNSLQKRIKLILALHP